MLRILLDNALVHTPEGTGVRVSAARDNGHVRLEVSDRGLGIKRQNMPHIFEPFFTSNDEAQGAGLGLAIARELADRMHGELSVRSGPGPHDLLAGAPRMKRAARAGGCVALALGGGAIAGCSLGGDDDGSSGASDSRPRRPTTRVEVVEGQGSGKGFDSQAIFKNEGQGVVTVISLFGTGSLDSTRRRRRGGGIGSGFVLNGDGEIATNAHVVTQGEGSDAQKAREVYVEFADGNRVEAKIVGQDPNADVALLKIDPKGLTLRPLPLGSNASVAVGEPVAAIGSPFGERQSLSVGVVSAIDRDIQSLNGEFAIPGAFQTDAAINPGNSGGPLVDARRQGDRHQPADQDATRAAARASASRSRSTSSSARSARCARPATPTTRTSASPPCRCSRSSWTAST